MNNKRIILLSIDSNIFLSFYDFSNYDLEQLVKLVELIETGKIKLFLTQQIVNEIKRTRDGIVFRAYKKFVDSKIAFDMPIICQSYPEYKEIKSYQKKLEKVKADLSKKLWQDINSKKLKAEEMINKLIKLSCILDSDQVLNEAEKRYLLGNPPGRKKNTYGDEINWETFLKFIPTDNHFIFISDDEDFKNPLNENELNSFLIQEWEKEKRTKIIFYRSLTSFFKEYEIDIELRWEEEKDKLIKELMMSPNFSTTHEIINKLSKFINFSNKQVKDIGLAALANNQISWIAQDVDVKDFYESNVLSRTSVFEENELERLKDLFLPNDNKEIDEINFEETPF